MFLMSTPRASTPRLSLSGTNSTFAFAMDILALKNH
jgi:hypothetical protein